jgi:hypothetical protein
LSHQRQPRSTFRSEPKVEITFESLKRTASEALHTYFTPVRLLFMGAAWCARYVTRLVSGRAKDEASTDKETPVRFRG